MCPLQFLCVCVCKRIFYFVFDFHFCWSGDPCIATSFFRQIMTLSDKLSVSLAILCRLLRHISDRIWNFLRGRRKPLQSLFIMLFYLFLICRVSTFLTFPVYPLRSWMLLVVLQILLNLPFVSSFLLPRSISVLQHRLYPLNFCSGCLNHLVLLPLIPLYSPSRQ